MPSIWLLCSCNEFFLSGDEPVAVDPVVVTETFVQEALPLVDILWVVDNTETMSQELQALEAQLSQVPLGLTLDPQVDLEALPPSRCPQVHQQVFPEAQQLGVHRQIWPSVPEFGIPGENPHVIKTMPAPARGDES